MHRKEANAGSAVPQVFSSGFRLKALLVPSCLALLGLRAHYRQLDKVIDYIYIYIVCGPQERARLWGI